MSRPASFWDRRRAAVRAEAEVEGAVEAADTPADPRSDQEILDDLKLPDPATLKMGDDFSAFMAKAVPVHLKNRALRQLWRSNPVLACVDGLNDYDADYLTGSTGNGPVKTLYQVGKGIVARLDEPVHTADAETPGPDTAEPDTAFSDAEPARADTQAAETTPEAFALEDDDTDAQTVAPAPRRMRFRFQEQTT
ncbi:DUF3306 domain-containing protein [Oceaniglobus indicus]|uniref:DUF3306 domain-containing protein n=1 Tax=Oceaniglobus indicus TaxID=2047749 RepID=UPI000C1A2897|nr:DUF3306 domain-containing protein [Oceaniglobus indicus]